MEVVLRAPAIAWVGGRATLPGWVPAATPGEDSPYEASALLGVPGPAGARLEVLEEDVVDLGHIPLVDAAAPGTTEVEGRPPAVEPLQQAADAAAIHLEPAGRARGRDLARLLYRPLVRRADGRVRFVREARVRVDFVDPARPLADAHHDPVHDVLLNARTAARWALSHARPKQRSGAELPPDRLRIQIDRTGVYELGYAALRDAGVPVGDQSFDPRTLRLYFDTWGPVPLSADSIPSSWQPGYELGEAAIWVVGQEDANFDPSEDRIVFYALGPQGWADLAGATADSLAWESHPHDRHRYGWLVWGGGFGRRMAVRSAASAEPPVDPLVVALPDRRHFEEDLVFGRADDLWYWTAARQGAGPTRVDLVLPPGGAAAGTLHLGFAAVAPWNATIAVRWNGSDLGTLHSDANQRSARFRFPGVALADTNRLEIRWSGGAGNTAWLLDADVEWERALAAESSGCLAWSSRPTTAAQVYEIQGFASPPLVFDVTEAREPVRLTEATAAGEGRWRVRHGRGPGQRAQYHAVATASAVATHHLEMRVVTSLRAMRTAPEVLVVTHESTRAAADRLAAHRRAHGPWDRAAEVQVVAVDEIYDEFSGGRLDPLAIRNFFKFLWNLAPGSGRPGFVVLFGDATYDTRQLLPENPPTLVPQVHGWFASDVLYPPGSLDDWIVDVDAPARSAGVLYPVADAAVGRLPVRDAAEAERVVDKIVAYEQDADTGPWRGRVLLAADDEWHSPFNDEVWPIYASEECRRRTPRELDVRKLYLTEYPFERSQKPAARAEFVRLWSEGNAIVNWSGHAGAGQLADEVALLNLDVPALENGGRLPLFIAFGSQNARFDRPRSPSLGEGLLASAAGGAIATIAPSGETYVGPATMYELAIFERLFAGGPTTRVPLGIAVQQAKLAGTPFNAHVTLLGDPALALRLPQARVAFEPGADTLQAGRRASLRGFVHLPGDSVALAAFTGEASIDVFGSADESGYEREDGFRIDYDLRGVPILRTRAPVEAGRFAVEFTVPTFGARAPSTGPRTAQLGAKGRLGAYAEAAALGAQGGRDDVVLMADAPMDSSRGAPRIALRDPWGRPRAEPGGTLTVEIRDENGIAITGTAPTNSILVAFDGGETQDVTAAFRAEGATDTVGTVEVRVAADLAAGQHALAVRAADNLGHATATALAFQVLAVTSAGLANVLAFPNPVRSWTHFFYEVGSPAEIELRVFTLNGREIWRAHQAAGQAGQGSVRWDAVDSTGDPVANGTYLYRLEARPSQAGAVPLQVTSRVVVMRN